MKMGARWRIAAAIVVAGMQIGVLSWAIAGRAAILRTGAEITLKVEPVDPRDLLRGDYVRLAYNVSSIDAALVANAQDDRVEQDQPVHVRLEENGETGIWQAKAVKVGTRFDDSPAAGEVDISGSAASAWAGNGDLRVHYGIERFYLPEGEGRAIERDLGTRSFTMKVAVGRDGTAQIKAFFDGATLLYKEPLF